MMIDDFLYRQHQDHIQRAAQIKHASFIRRVLDALARLFFS